MNEKGQRAPSKEEIEEENRRLRRLRIAVNLALNIIAQGQMPIEEATQLVAATRRVALQLFPDKGETFDLIYQPKFQRLMNEVYHLN